jgi:hypothetical protein
MRDGIRLYIYLEQQREVEKHGYWQSWVSDTELAWRVFTDLINFKVLYQGSRK